MSFGVAMFSNYSFEKGEIFLSATTDVVVIDEFLIESTDVVSELFI